MTRIRLVVERHGLSLAEFFVLEMASVFATDPKTAARFISNTLKGYADVDGLVAVKSCVQKWWLVMSCGRVLKLTQKGTELMRKIASEL
jgi:hypothetical protein